MKKVYTAKFSFLGEEKVGYFVANNTEDLFRQVSPFKLVGIMKCEMFKGYEDEV